MTNILATVGMCWQPSVAEQVWPAADTGVLAAAPAAKSQAHAALLPVGADAAVARPRGYAFAIRPRGTPPV